MDEVRNLGARRAATSPDSSLRGDLVIRRADPLPPRHNAWRSPPGAEQEANEVRWRCTGPAGIVDTAIQRRYSVAAQQCSESRRGAPILPTSKAISLGRHRPAISASAESSSIESGGLAVDVGHTMTW